MTIKTPVQLKTEITADFPDNTTGLITPALLRTVTTDIVDTVASGASSFNVKQYGAVGDGSTDDTTATNAAIAAFNTATKGVLYFPAGTYKVTSSLTTITANGLIIGDGGATSNGISASPRSGATQIVFTSTNTTLFTTTSAKLLFRDLSISGPAIPVAGCIAVSVQTNAIVVGAEVVSFLRVDFTLFYDILDIQTGSGWFVHDCGFTQYAHWGIRARNINISDVGAWKISNSGFFVFDGPGTPLAGIRIESGGGDHIEHCNISGVAGHNPMTVAGIDLSPTVVTTDLFIDSCSIEGLGSGCTGILLNGAAGGTWTNTSISNCEFGFNSGGAGPNITINAGASKITNVVITGILCQDVQPIAFTGTCNLSVSNVNYVGSYTQIFGTIGSAPVAANDATGGVGGGQFFQFSTHGSGLEQRLAWTFPTGSKFGEFYIQAPDAGGVPFFRLANFAGNLLQLIIDASSGFTGATITSDGQLLLISDNAVASGGSHPVIISAGGSTSEVARFLPAGNVKFTNAANFSANGSVATVLGSVGPAGASTTVTKWLTIVDSGGVTRYIPCF